MPQNSNPEPTPKCVTKKELRVKYRVGHTLFSQMLNRVPGLTNKNARILFPNDLELIYKVYGNPY